ncbi:hypothetical protein N800_03900 [Lysobacter daejeonensis GH1-9]|uniref:Uncharacterized protein n=1 Tax=Lysobacter daejeonensis GH1-9 TaxID=1385517 RepID=A0A0A0ERH3_9GAMM|nr:hypothetical protein [Lysobacter daejeonensis]KGM53576.1 hypothetical protein N800_03900 [Lysobacter daejeonensis GH1-9]
MIWPHGQEIDPVKGSLLMLWPAMHIFNDFAKDDVVFFIGFHDVPVQPNALIKPSRKAALA